MLFFFFSFGVEKPLGTLGEGGGYCCWRGVWGVVWALGMFELLGGSRPPPPPHLPGRGVFVLGWGDGLSQPAGVPLHSSLFTSPHQRPRSLQVAPPSSGLCPGGPEGTPFLLGNSCCVARPRLPFLTAGARAGRVSTSLSGVEAQAFLLLLLLLYLLLLALRS